MTYWEQQEVLGRAPNGALIIAHPEILEDICD
jgi:hypothetical protein